ncbi:MAG: tryptophan synthase subunit beta, partial [Candidatus Dormibacteraceae bacterium]
CPSGRPIVVTSPAASSLPNTEGYFSALGGRYVPEALISALEELEFAFNKVKSTPQFQADFDSLLTTF